MIRFNVWETVYYRHWTDKTGKVIMHPGRFVGFTWNIGDPMIFKVIQCNEDLNKQNVVVHRGFIVPHYLTATG